MKIKNYLVIYLLLSTFAINAQEGSLKFSYDSGGNLIERKLQIVIEGELSRHKNENELNDSLILWVEKYIKLYPNPSNSSVYIEGALPNDIQSAEVTLLDLEGRILKSEIYYGQLLRIDVNGLSNGMYLLQLKVSNEYKRTYKIIISK